MSADSKPRKDPKARKQRKGRSIGLDLGGVRCGVAIDDELGLVAHPRPNLEAKDRKQLVQVLTQLARSENAGRFVLGLPLEPTGKEGRAAERVRTFAQHLADATGLDVAASAVEFCRKPYGESEKLRFVEGSARELPFPDASFDVLLNVEASNDSPDRMHF